MRRSHGARRRPPVRRPAARCGTPAAIAGQAGGRSRSAAATSGLAGAGAGGSAAQPSTGGQIQADPATNSLIITAPEPQYRQLRAVIDKLDARRAQVFVESLIVEVNADKAAEFGIQWQSAAGINSDATRRLRRHQLRRRGPAPTSLERRPRDLDPLGAGPQPRRHQGHDQHPGDRRDHEPGVPRALAREQTASANMLSTPNLLTLDNEEAKIVIGQNVPFVTGQFTNDRRRQRRSTRSRPSSARTSA